MRQPLTREAISAAARDILVAEGLHAVSLRRVASRLGVTAPALYAHVIDKRDLLQGIAEQELGHLAERFAAITETDPVERLRAMCRAYVEYACANPDLFRAMFLFRPELTAESRADKPPLATRVLHMLAEPVRDARASGGLDSGASAELDAFTLLAATHGAATMLVAGPAVDIEVQARLADSVIDSVIGGLRRTSEVQAA